LARFGAAHERMREDHFGKIVLRVD